MMNRNEIEAKINARVWKDPGFKKKLLEHPQDALKSLGIESLPQGLKIHVVEERKNEWVLVLHAVPVNADKLSEKDLMKAAAGRDMATWYCGNPGGLV